MAPFSLSCCAFFGFWVGGVKTMTRNLLVLVKSQVYERLCHFSAVWGGALCIFLSCHSEQSDYLHSNITIITFPERTPRISRCWVRRVGISDDELLLFTCLKHRSWFHLRFRQTLICVFSDVTHSAKTRSAFSFYCLVCWALIAFESDATGPFPLCAPCRECAPRFFDSLSVRLMFQKVDMCAPCNAVFTEPPQQDSAHCIHGTEGPDEITQFTAALSSGWRQQGKGSCWASYGSSSAVNNKETKSESSSSLLSCSLIPSS